MKGAGRPGGDRARSADERIREVVARIPSGRVATYGQVARLAGLPRRARMVGRALRGAPAGVRLPWHRVVNAAGYSSLPEGSEARSAQLERLRREGVQIAPDGRVALEESRWEPSLDELLWGPGGA